MRLAGIIGGLLAYIIINGANLLLDKVAECLHWSIAGSDAQPALSGSASGSFITRLQSNTGGAAQVWRTLKASMVQEHDVHGLACNWAASAGPGNTAANRLSDVCACWVKASGVCRRG